MKIYNPRLKMSLLMLISLFTGSLVQGGLFWDFLQKVRNLCLRSCPKLRTPGKSRAS